MHTSIRSRLASLSIAFAMTFVMLASIDQLAGGDAGLANIAAGAGLVAASAAQS